jgi:hypothetical protein
VNELNRCNQFLQPSLCGGGCSFLSQERSQSVHFQLESLMCFTTEYRFKDPKEDTQLFAIFTSHLEAMVARRQPCPRPAAKARFTVEDRLWVRRAVKGQVGMARVGHIGRGRRNHHKICCRIFTRCSTMHLQDVAQHRCVVGAEEQAVGSGRRSRKSMGSRSSE